MASYYKTAVAGGYTQYYWATSYPIGVTSNSVPGTNVPDIDIPRTDIPDSVGWDEDNDAWTVSKLNAGGGRLKHQLIVVGSDDSGNGKIYFEDV